MRTTGTILLAALASVAIAHSVKPDYYKNQHDGGADDHVAHHQGSGERPGKGFLDHIKGSWGKDPHAHGGAAHHGHGHQWADDDDENDSELKARDALFGFGNKNKGKGKGHGGHQGHPSRPVHGGQVDRDGDLPNQGPDDDDPSNFLPNNMHDVTPFPAEEYYDDEGKVLDHIPSPKKHHARDADAEAKKSHGGLSFPNEEWYDDEGRLIGAEDGYDNEDEEDGVELNLPEDDDSRQMRANWWAAEQRDDYPDRAPPGWTDNEDDEDDNTPSRPSGHGNAHAHAHGKPKHHHARSAPHIEDDEDEDDDDVELNLPNDEHSRKHRQAWWDEEQRNGHQGHAPAGGFHGQHDNKPSYHRHYSAHQMRGVDVDREAATNSDQYYYDVGDEGDEGEYDPSYGGEDYDEGFEKRDAKKQPKPPKAPKAPKPKKGKGWSMFPW
ncbi:uncharacterized protein LTR77_005606 [Saxophila tyrrhenica]|uniref:Uncharacterized protein n=1 Tax=Saxophila tyrrhenica TaxID=1690608 RepID=A0AAV9PCF7_9PEZI|nr:hypothetical protein LTR77_005606 [Saxophila tyrrhenica]